MEPAILYKIWIMATYKYNINPNMTRAIWDRRPCWQTSWDGRTAIPTRFARQVRYVGTDLRGLVAVRHHQHLHYETLDLVSTSDPTTSLRRLIPYHLASTAGRIPLQPPILRCAASFSLDGSLVAVAVYQNNTFVIYVFDVRTGAEVKALHTKCCALTNDTRLCFEQATLHFIGADWAAKAHLYSWDIATWKPASFGNASVRLIPPKHLLPLTTAPSARVTTLCASDDPTKRLVLLFYAGRIQLWDPATRHKYSLHTYYRLTTAYGITAHYRSDLRTLWIAIRAVDEFRWWLYEFGHNSSQENESTWVKRKWRIPLRTRPHDIAVDAAGRWVVLAGTGMLARIDRSAPDFLNKAGRC